MTELQNILIKSDEDNIKDAIQTFKRTNNLKDAITQYCHTLKDKYNNKEIDIIIMGVHQCRQKIKNFVDELKNGEFDLNDITTGIEAVGAIYECYSVSTGYVQNLYRKSKLPKPQRQEKKRAVLNTIIYLAISFEAPDPYDDLLKKIWKNKGESILNNLMVVKNWFRESLPGCIRKLCSCF